MEEKKYTEKFIEKLNNIAFQNGLERKDILKLFGMTYKPDNEYFIKYINKFDLEDDDFSFDDLEKYEKKKAQEKKRKEEIEKAKKQVEDNKKALEEAEAKLKELLNPKREPDDLFVRIFKNEHNKTTCIEAITEKNLLCMTDINMIPQQINVNNALKILRKYIKKNKIKLNGTILINVLASGGFLTFKSLNNLAEFNAIKNIEMEEYSIDKIYAVQIVCTTKLNKQLIA